MLSNRMTANNLELNPTSQASDRIQNVSKLCHAPVRHILERMSFFTPASAMTVCMLPPRQYFNQSENGKCSILVWQIDQQKLAYSWLSWSLSINLNDSEIVWRHTQERNQTGAQGRTPLEFAPPPPKNQAFTWCEPPPPSDKIGSCFFLFRSACHWILGKKPTSNAKNYIMYLKWSWNMKKIKQILTFWFYSRLIN